MAEYSANGILLLTLRKSDTLDQSCAKSLNQEVEGKYCNIDLLDKVLTDNNLKDAPRQI